jgi:hypothetical protein
MLRFVLGPDGQVVPDLAAKLPGRGMWLSARADVVEAAKSRGGLQRAFARAARGQVVLPADLPGLLHAGLRRRLVEHIGLARRAGQAVAGFTKAREWLQAGKVGLLLEAADGSEDERRRLLSGVRNMCIAWPFTGDTLGAVFGRDHTVHVAIAEGRLAEALLNDVVRLGGISGQVLSKQADA